MVTDARFASFVLNSFEVHEMARPGGQAKSPSIGRVKGFFSFKHAHLTRKFINPFHLVVRNELVYRTYCKPFKHLVKLFTVFF